jgi:hypothetical protein
MPQLTIGQIFLLVWGALGLWGTLSSIFPDLFQVRGTAMSELLWGANTKWVSLFLIAISGAVYLWILDGRVNAALDRLQAQFGLIRPDEKQLGEWLSSLPVSVRKSPAQGKSFGYELTAKGRRIHVVYSEATPAVIALMAGATTTPEQTRELRALSERDRNKVALALSNSLSASGMAFTVNLNADPPQIALQDFMVYDEPMTKKELSASIKRLISAIDNVLVALGAELDFRDKAH